MSFESKMKYPRPEQSVDALARKIERYIAKGLSRDEAEDLAQIQSVEYNEGELSAGEIQRRDAYLAKLRIAKKK